MMQPQPQGAPQAQPDMAKTVTAVGQTLQAMSEGLSKSGIPGVEHLMMANKEFQTFLSMQGGQGQPSEPQAPEAQGNPNARPVA